MSQNEEVLVFPKNLDNIPEDEHEALCNLDMLLPADVDEKEKRVAKDPAGGYEEPLEITEEMDTVITASATENSSENIQDTVEEQEEARSHDLDISNTQVVESEKMHSVVLSVSYFINLFY